MGLFSQLRNRKNGTMITNPTTDIHVLENDEPASSDNATSLEPISSREEKKEADLEAGPEEEPAIQEEEPLDEDNIQMGVRNARAITATWSRTSLIITYTCMFLLYFINAFQSSITGNLSAYIVSGFESHSLIPVIGIVSSVMSAATYMPLAKGLNLWDRSYGFAVMTVFAIIGLILSATCNGIGTYCASQVFYSIGFTGMIFSIDVITIDTSSLRDRGLAYAFTSSPYIITAFAGSAASEHFYDWNWRWAYGLFAIVLPFVAAPLFLVLHFNKKKAAKLGLLVKEESGRNWKQSIMHYIIEFDILGVFLLAAGLVIFLLPFSLASSYDDDWASVPIICMLVFGLVCLILFVVVEKWVAPKPFVPFHLLISRTILGACLLDFTYQIAYYCWDDYFTSYLQVTFNTSITVAGYISSIFDVVSGVWLLFVGYAIRRTGYFRWLLYFSVPLYMLGIGLMIYFRKPGGHFGYIIMCQIFAAFGGGTMIIVQQVAVLAAASHNNAAAVLALLGLFGYIGGAVGGAISGAIWTHTLPSALQKYLPADVVDDWEEIYDDLDVQLSYEVGTEIRTAIINAYAEAQSKMLIAGTVIMSASLIWMFVIKNVKVSGNQQVKGMLF